MTLQHSTIRSKRQERLAKNVIYLFVAITLILLVWIVGYVLFKGFVTIDDTASMITAERELAISSLDYPQDEYYIIAHPKVRVEELTSQELYEIYTKRRQANWGDITTQNLKVWPFMYEQGSEYYDSASTLVRLNESDDLGDYVSYITDTQQMVSYIQNVEGAIGLIPSGSVGQAVLDELNVVPIRQMSLAIHPSVTSIFDNRQLRELDEEQLEGLLEGLYTNWSELGGPDLSINLLAFSEYAADQSSATVYTDLENLLSDLQTTEGAAALLRYSDVENNRLDTLDTIIHTVKRNLTWHYIVEEPARSGAWGGISSIILNTLVLILFTLLFSSPIGVMAAIYLVEYSAQNRFIRILRLGTETLAGIPSIVFGLFGYIFFVSVLGLGIGFISATLTITLMILPTIIRTSEEALKSVPSSYREGSLALGATQLKTIYKVVLPAASPGILSGIILAVGRVIGETAVLIYTLGSNYELVSSPTSSARVLSLHIYNLFAEAISFERSFATATVLIFMILLVNFGTNTLIGRISKQQRS